MRYCIAFFASGALWLSAVAVQGQEGPKGKEKDKNGAPAPAPKDNADAIARLQLLRQAMHLTSEAFDYHTLVSKSTVDEMTARSDMKKLEDAGQLALADKMRVAMMVAQVAKTKAKQAYDAKLTQLLFHLDKLPGNPQQMSISEQVIFSRIFQDINRLPIPENLADALIKMYGGTPGDLIPTVPAPKKDGEVTPASADGKKPGDDLKQMEMTFARGTMPINAEALKKMLTGKISLAGIQSQQDLIENLRKNLKGLNLTETDMPLVNVSLANIDQPISLGAALAMTEDLMFVRFVLREYGVMVTMKGREPAGGVPLVDYWKHSSSAPQVKGGKK